MPNNKIVVSIILPCYNAERWIEQTINSIQKQSFQAIEVIVVNDGSTDNTFNILNKLKEIDKSIKIITKRNTGVSDSRNKGLEICKGNYIVFFDADDLMAEDFLQARIEQLEKNTNIDYCGGSIIYIDENNNPKAPIILAPFSNPFHDVLFYKEGTVTCPSNFMYRVNTLKEKNIKFNTKLVSSADRFFLLEISHHLKYINVYGEKSMLKYRIHSNSMSHHITPKRAIDTENLFFELVSKFSINDRLFFKKYFYMIAGTYYQVGNYIKTFKYGLAYLFEFINLTTYRSILINKNK